jgi:hypothetical protein
MTNLTPGFGVWEALLQKALAEAEILGVAQSAENNHVSVSTIYVWRKKAKAA